MILNNVVAREIAEYLLEIKAIQLNTEKPYTWASGWKSPIYCDNRITLSYQKVRNYIKTSFADIIHEEFNGVEVIAGVATAGIPHGILIADVLNLPFIYVRDKPKGHGLTNQIEGHFNKGQKVMVIEDLISTGGSSLKAVAALREAELDVVGLGAIFDYGFSVSEAAFEKEKIRYFSLSDYETLIEKAIENDYVKPAQKPILSDWRQNPEAWMTA